MRWGETRDVISRAGAWLGTVNSLITHPILSFLFNHPTLFQLKRLTNVLECDPKLKPKMRTELPLELVHIITSETLDSAFVEPPADNATSKHPYLKTIISLASVSKDFFRHVRDEIPKHQVQARHESETVHSRLREHRKSTDPHLSESDLRFCDARRDCKECGKLYKETWHADSRTIVIIQANNAMEKFRSVIQGKTERAARYERLTLSRRYAH